MSEETLAAFQAALAEDPALREKFAAATSAEAAAAVAADAGFTVSADQFGAHGELTDADLSNVAGGVTSTFTPRDIDPRRPAQPG